LPETGELLGKVSLAESKAGFEMTDARLSIVQQGLQDVEADRVTKRSKQVRRRSTLHPGSFLYSVFAI
jgi:hypothetical protein